MSVESCRTGRRELAAESAEYFASAAAGVVRVVRECSISHAAITAQSGQSVSSLVILTLITRGRYCAKLEFMDLFTDAKVVVIT